MADIGSLIVRIGADAGELHREFDRLGRAGQTFGDQIARAGKLAAIGLTAAATAAAGLSIAIFELAKTTANTGDEFAKMSARTGESVETLSALTFAAELADASAEALQKGFKTLGTAAFDASRTTGEQSEAFRLLKVNVEDTQDKLKPTMALFLEVADRLKALGNETQRNALGVQLFGRSWQDLAPLVLQGSAAIHEGMLEAQALGVTWTTGTARAAEAFNDNLKRVTATVEGLRNIIGNAFIPIIDSLMGRYLDWFKSNQAIISQDVKAWAESTAKSVAGFVNDIINFTRATNDLVSGPLGSLFKTELQGLGAVFILLSHAIRETSGEMSTFFKNIGKSDFIKRFNLDALKAGIDKLDKETAGKLANIFNPLMLSGGETGPSVPPPPAAVPPSGIMLDTTKTKAGPFVATNREALEGLAIVERTKAQQKGLLDLEMQEITELLRRNELSALFGTSMEVQIRNEKQGALTVAESTLAYQRRFETLQNQGTVQDALLRQQQAMFATDTAFADKAGAARRVAFEAQRLQEEQTTQLLQDQFLKRAISFDTYQAKLTALQLDGETKRRQIVEEFPTFWEQQLQAVVNSNAFSVSAIITTWTSGIATLIVEGGKFHDFMKQAWKATEIAILQGAINTGVQLVAQWALQASVEMGILEATEAAKLGLKTTTNAALVANEAGAAAASVSIWAGASAAILGFFTGVAAGFTALTTSLVVAVTTVGTFIMGVLGAIATALSATVFGIPYAGAILVGVAAIAAALAAAKVIKLGEGGIVTGPTLAMVGERQPETVLPFDIRDLQGGMGQRMTVIVPVQLNGREIARVIAPDLPRGFRQAGAPI